MPSGFGNLVNGRCYLAPLVDTIHELRDKIMLRHWDILKRTPFSHLMDIEPIVQERSILDALMQAFDERTRTFKLGESHLHFRDKDVSLLLGLKMEEEYFTKSVDRNKDCSVRVLQGLVLKKDHKGEENFVKLLLIYIMGFLLFSILCCLAPEWLTHYVDDLSTLGEYAWVHVTHRFFMEIVPAVSSRVKDRCSSKLSSPGYLKGCAFPLSLWFYEVTRTRKRTYYGKSKRIVGCDESSFKKQSGAEAFMETLKGQKFFTLVPENEYEVDLIGSGKLDGRITRRPVLESSTTMQSSRLVKIRPGKEKEVVREEFLLKKSR
ncbi:hypothetical protein IHE45_02G028900 [Dioscorea alata]|uniref:Uncharacterized protein n=1 Tax=Dioscorea alata TaxID=55571 RepID=A0ACB7WPU5_DIOAL|nr:hypothetical protein IHE45_02G028900 [Dioscorea alata]